MNCVCIIPARGGSTRIPMKNIKMFHGKPIIAYSINAAIESGIFDRVIVSTDNQLIAAVAMQYGAEVIIRSEEMSRNEVGTQTVAASVLRQIELPDGVACVIYPTAPLMTVDDLIRGREALNHPDTTFAFSVCEDPLSDAGQWYWGYVWAFLLPMPLISPESSMVPIPKNRVCDINLPEDFIRAEKMYASLYR